MGANGVSGAQRANQSSNDNFFDNNIYFDIHILFMAGSVLNLALRIRQSFLDTIAYRNENRFLVLDQLQMFNDSSEKKSNFKFSTNCTKN